MWVAGEAEGAKLLHGDGDGVDYPPALRRYGRAIGAPIDDRCVGLQARAGPPGSLQRRFDGPELNCGNRGVSSVQCRREANRFFFF